MWYNHLGFLLFLLIIGLILGTIRYIRAEVRELEKREKNFATYTPPKYESYYNFIFFSIFALVCFAMCEGLYWSIILWRM